MILRAPRAGERDRSVRLWPGPNAFSDNKSRREQRHSGGRRRRVGIQFGRFGPTMTKHPRKDRGSPHRRIRLMGEGIVENHIRDIRRVKCFQKIAFAQLPRKHPGNMFPTSAFQQLMRSAMAQMWKTARVSDRKFEWIEIALKTYEAKGANGVFLRGVLLFKTVYRRH